MQEPEAAPIAHTGAPRHDAIDAIDATAATAATAADAGRLPRRRQGHTPRLRPYRIACTALLGTYFLFGTTTGSRELAVTIGVAIEAMVALYVWRAIRDRRARKNPRPAEPPAESYAELQAAMARLHAADDETRR
jgi:Flp pilus assembly protein TadB